MISSRSASFFIKSIFIPVKRSFFIIGEKVSLLIIYTYKNRARCSINLTCSIHILQRNIVITGMCARDVDAITVIIVAACIDIKMKSTIIAF